MQRRPALRIEQRRAGLGRTAVVFVLVGAAALALVSFRAWRGPAEDIAIEGALVRKGPLRITVTSRGSLEAADTVRLSSGVEGRTTILSVVPEGSEVVAGQVVCELDATAMVERRIEQAITLGNAEAALVKARQTHEIQQSQNTSDIEKARRAIEFAEQDLQMFLEGERAMELEQAQQAIDLAREEDQRARDRLAWSQKLGDKGFLTTTELEADRIAMHRAEVALQQALQTQDLLKRFKSPRRETELRAAVVEAQQEGERVRLQAAARLIDFDSDVRTSQATLALEQQKLARLDAQIDAAKIRATQSGYVIYAQRDNDEPPIAAGAEVREREEILSIPSSAGMTVGVKLHESVLNRVRAGQECRVTIDALPGVHVDGRMANVAMLPDQNTRWMNPNLRVYKAQVAITTQSPALRPGMSCAVEILVDELADATHVPLQAVFVDRESSIAFVSAGGDVERRPVRVGQFNELWVEILEGLRPGETVLMSAPPGFDAKPTAAAKPDDKRAPANGAEPPR